MECGTSVHSNKLLDHDGDPFCVRCHNKVFHLLHPSRLIISSLFQKSFMDLRGMDMHYLGRRAARLPKTVCVLLTCRIISMAGYSTLRT